MSLIPFEFPGDTLSRPLNASDINVITWKGDGFLWNLTIFKHNIRQEIPGYFPKWNLVLLLRNNGCHNVSSRVFFFFCFCFTRFSVNELLLVPTKWSSYFHSKEHSPLFPHLFCDPCLRLFCSWTDFVHVLTTFQIARPSWAPPPQPDYPLSTIVQLPFFLLGRRMRAVGRVCSWLWLAHWHRHSDDLGIMCMWWDIWDRSHETVLFSLSTNGTFFLFPWEQNKPFPLTCRTAMVTVSDQAG